jgi:IclR family transcriptional regulator, acetate operon repressor
LSAAAPSGPLDATLSGGRSYEQQSESDAQLHEAPYAATLVELGYLQQDSKRRYRLTRDAARAGMTAIDRVRQETPARAILEDLRDQTGHTVSTGLLDWGRVLYVVRLYGHRAGQFEADGDLSVGAHVPAYSTAVGKALLASLLGSEFRSLLPSMRLRS